MLLKQLRRLSKCALHVDELHGITESLSPSDIHVDGMSNHVVTHFNNHWVLSEATGH